MRTPTKTNNELFDRFWKAYPRKEGKPKAMSTFEKLKITPDILENILAELKRQSKLKDWRHINTKYIPLAQTWLNRRDWEEVHGSDTDNDTKNKYGTFI